MFVLGWDLRHLIILGRQLVLKTRMKGLPIAFHWHRRGRVAF